MITETDEGAQKRFRKHELLYMVSLLEKTNDTIVKTVSENPDSAAGACISCQETAILIGTYLESLGETYAGLVGLLEDYCENVFQMSKAVPEETQCVKIAKKIQKQLSRLKSGIAYDLPEDRKEVVFLPAMASMWDSLESVWRAADDDPDCDTYVIPIPYYDKNPDGSFKEEHYEGNQYPKDVPITHYDEYDLEARHPDVIYIHNPYDGLNLVTSVHPRFYAQNLKNFTDKLVYIPYFVLGEVDLDDWEAAERMERFCYAPGTIYADEVIVQSETMRQVFINVFQKVAKEEGLSGEHLDRKFLEKKFLGTGSPKFDKVRNTKKEDLEIPDEWRKVIEKPNGSCKKIVFYNNSVNALLHHDEKMLQKMESVFQMFLENKDEVALLWRPHPLIRATIENMRPRLWEKYERLVRKYREEDWGIYDDSADVDRAVVLCDAYYGDRSSIVQLCGQIGKMIMIQSVKLTEYEFLLPEADRPRREALFMALRQGKPIKERKKIGLGDLLSELSNGRSRT